MALMTLCAELPGLRAECAQQSAWHRQLLARVEDEARARRPILDLLGELLGVGTVRSLSHRPPGVGPGRAHEERFGCPDGACDREVVPLPAGPVPHCWVTGTPLKPR
jgi:hypothetical protein